MGLPQLDYSWYFNQIFWTTVVVGYIYILVRYFYVPKMSLLMSLREDRVLCYKNEASTAREKLKENEYVYNRDIEATYRSCQNDLDAQIKKSRDDHVNYKNALTENVKLKVKSFEDTLISQFVTDRVESHDTQVLDKYIESVKRRTL